MKRNVEYEIGTLTTNDGKTWYFAIEILDNVDVVVIGYGCENKKDAQTILDSFLED